MARQRAAFAHALHWVYGELVAQRAQEPVAFLAQLGRDHRKYGVLPEHYETLRQALHATLRDELAEAWTDAVDAAAEQSLNLITGVMSGAADAEQGPAWWDGTVLEHLRISRDLAVVRLQLDRSMPYHAGQYVNVAVPQCPRRWRYLTPAIPSDDSGAIEFHVRTVSGGMVSNAIVHETRPGDRWRLSSPHGGLQVDRDGGDVLMVAGSTGLAPLRSIVMDLTRWGVNPRVHMFFGARYPLRALRPTHPVADRVTKSLAVGHAGVGVQRRPRLGRRLSGRDATARTASAADRHADGRRHQIRRLGRPADPDLRRAGHGARHQGRADRQRGPAGAYSARPAGALAARLAGVHIVTLQDPSSELEAQFVPDTGMIGISLTDSGVELLGQRRGLEAYVAASKTMGIPILYPWANRLGASTYTGRRHNGDADAGAKWCARRPQRAADPRCARRLSRLAGDARVGQRADRRSGLRRVRTCWPAFRFRIVLALTVTLFERTLTVRTVVTPTGEQPVPLCFGFHPYLQLPDVPRDQWIVETPPLRHLYLDGQGLPTGETSGQPANTEPLGDKTFDDGYDEVADGAVFAVSGGGRRIEVHFERGVSRSAGIRAAGRGCRVFRADGGAH